ncbi:PadR family transcriptional regulator [Lysinibacillus fusiformis]
MNVRWKDDISAWLSFTGCLCIGTIVDKEDAYGYSLTQQVQSVMDISESTLYPVLRRLQKADYLTTYDQPYQGRNRRYYQITEHGTYTLIGAFKRMACL